MINGNEGVYPSGWQEVSIREVCDVISGKTPKGINDLKSEGDIPFFKISDMNLEGNEVYLSDSAITLSRDQVEELRVHIREAGTVVFPKRGGAIATNKVRLLAQSSAYDLNIMGVRSDVIESKLLYYWFSSIDFKSLADGSNVPQINHKDIEPLRIPLIPLNEQRRIVAKIEELFSDLDAGVAQLKQVQQQLKRYRQSVLKAAVEGKLTAAWRAQHGHEVEPAEQLLARILEERRAKWEAEQLAKYEAKGKKPPKGWQDKYKEPEPPDTSDLPELPTGWVWATVEQIGFTDVGFAFKSKEFVETGMRLLRGANIEPGGLKWDDIRYWDLDKLESYENLLVEEGDIILAMDRPLISSGLKIARAAKEDVPCLLVQRVARFRLMLKQIDDFVYMVMQTNRFVEHLLAGQTGTQLPHISASGINSFVMPIPSIDEMMIIQNELKRMMSIIDFLETSVPDEMRRAERLRQGILKKAFEGGLVEQDSGDTSALHFFAITEG